MRTGTIATQNWVLTDHLGSTAVTANYSGGKLSELRYREASRSASGVDKAYGETRYTWGTMATDYRYTGQKLDSSVGLYLMGARWYDSYLNRWIQPDTIIPDLANPQSLNRYSYCLGNPLAYRDEDGHFPIPDWDQFSQGIQAAIESGKALATGDYERAKDQAVYAALTMSGAKDLIVNVAEFSWTLIDDTQTAFSHQPLEKRVLPAIRVGTFAVMVANPIALAAAGPAAAGSQLAFQEGFSAEETSMVQQVASKYRIDLKGIDIWRGSARPGVSGSWDPGNLTLFDGAFATEEELAKTLFEEVVVHGGQNITEWFPGVADFAELEAQGLVEQWWQWVNSVLPK